MNSAYQSPHFSYAYEHVSERLLERYRLFLTPEIWDAWHHAILGRTDDALFIMERCGKDSRCWRVMLDGVAVFVLERGGVIRTVLPNYGWFIRIAREAAAARGETSLGLKLPADEESVKKIVIDKAKPEKKKDEVSVEREIETEIALSCHLEKLQRIRMSDKETKSQAELFVKAAAHILQYSDYVGIWKLAYKLFPDDPAWSGRPPGEENVDDEIAKSIRAEYVPGVVGCKKLGKKYSISGKTVRHIIYNRMNHDPDWTPPVTSQVEEQANGK